MQQKGLESICEEHLKAFLDSGSVISVAAFHTETAIKSIDARKAGKTDYEQWNFYADEYNRLNMVLNDICFKLAKMLDGIPLKATLELGKRVRSVEEYYPLAMISHRVAAEHAGVGFRGKHELIVTKQNGPALRLNSVITAEELDKDERMASLCGDCRACLDSCRILQKKNELSNYRQQCMERINGLGLRHAVCGVCLRACYENGNWRKC
jgi:epoxyqueuosine reductase QueG